MYLDWLVPVVIRLENFFQYFDNSPHQRAAIQRLQEDIDPELLKTNAQWFEIWKAGGKLTVFKVREDNSDQVFAQNNVGHIVLIIEFLINKQKEIDQRQRNEMENKHSK